MNKVLSLLLLLAFAKCKAPEEKAPPIQEIPTFTISQKDVPIYADQVGQIYGLKDIPIRARVDGFLEEVAFEEGSVVQKNKLLYRIDPNPYLTDVAAMESQVSEAETKMTNAKNELDRYKPLAEINAVSQSDLDAAQANYDASKAAVKAAKANLDAAKINLSYCTIKSPITGIVGKTNVRVGEYVGRSPSPVILTTVSRIDTVRVQFSISEKNYLFMAKERKARKAHAEKNTQHRGLYNVSLILADGSVFDQNGKIDFINNQIDPTTGSIMVQASFPNPDGVLRPGLYAKARIKSRTVKNALLVPQRCLQEVQGNYTVFTVDENNTVHKTPIEVGKKVGDMIIVNNGLKNGEKIVIDALQKVRDGLVISPIKSTFTSKNQP